MKKTLSKLSVILAVTAAVFSMAACHSDIYTMILNEVPLESNGITGHITGLVPFTADGKTKLYTSNGYIYSRDISNQSTENSSTWNENWGNRITPADLLSVNKGSYDAAENFNQTNGKFVYLASDSSYIYAMSIIWYENADSENTVWRKDIWYSANGTDWNPIDLSSFVGTSSEAADNMAVASNSASRIGLIFSNNSQDASLRHAYIKLAAEGDSEYSIYRLNGGAVPSEKITARGASSSSISCVNYKGQDYFSPYYSIVSNDTYMYFCATSDSTSSTSKSRVLYYADGYDETNKAFTLNGSTVGSVSTGCGYITSLGLCSEYILLGTTTGIYQAAIGTDAVPASTTSSFTTNAASIFTSSYEVYPIYVVDQTKKSTETDIFAAMDIAGTLSSSSHGLFEECGIYAYYPARGYWNKDGTADSSTKGN